MQDKTENVDGNDANTPTFHPSPDYTMLSDSEFVDEVKRLRTREHALGMLGKQFKLSKGDMQQVVMDAARSKKASVIVGVPHTLDPNRGLYDLVIKTTRSTNKSITDAALDTVFGRDAPLVRIAIERIDEDDALAADGKGDPDDKTSANGKRKRSNGTSGGGKRRKEEDTESSSKTITSASKSADNKGKEKERRYNTTAKKRSAIATIETTSAFLSCAIRKRLDESLVTERQSITVKEHKDPSTAKTTKSKANAAAAAKKFNWKDLSIIHQDGCAYFVMVHFMERQHKSDAKANKEALALLAVSGEDRMLDVVHQQQKQRPADNDMKQEAQKESPSSAQQEQEQGREQEQEQESQHEAQYSNPGQEVEQCRRDHRQQQQPQHTDTRTIESNGQSQGQEQQQGQELQKERKRSTTLLNDKYHGSPMVTTTLSAASIKPEPIDEPSAARCRVLAPDLLSASVKTEQTTVSPTVLHSINTMSASRQSALLEQPHHTKNTCANTTSTRNIIKPEHTVIVAPQKPLAQSFQSALGLTSMMPPLTRSQQHQQNASNGTHDSESSSSSSPSLGSSDPEDADLEDEEEVSPRRKSVDIESSNLSLHHRSKVTTKPMPKKDFPQVLRSSLLTEASAQHMPLKDTPRSTAIAWWETAEFRMPLLRRLKEDIHLRREKEVKDVVAFIDRKDAHAMQIRQNRSNVKK